MRKFSYVVISILIIGIFSNASAESKTLECVFPADNEPGKFAGMLWSVTFDIELSTAEVTECYPEGTVIGGCKTYMAKMTKMPTILSFSYANNLSSFSSKNRYDVNRQDLTVYRKNGGLRANCDLKKIDASKNRI